MKKLLLVRHAKAETISSGQKDFDRNLANKGLMDAPRMAQMIANEQVFPQVIISSPAARAFQTAQFFAEQLKINESDIQLNENIYEASPGTLLKIINQLSDDYEFVALFGHNPGFSYLAEYLSGAEIGEIPTCGSVLLSFEVDEWKFISQNMATLEKFWNPKYES